LSLYMTVPELTSLSNSDRINDSSMITFAKQKLRGLCLYWSMCCDRLVVMANYASLKGIEECSAYASVWMFRLFIIACLIVPSAPPS
jgi:hypothetical protein